MVFSSITFLFLFLPWVLLLYYLAPGKRYKNILLLIASLFFYTWGEEGFVIVMLASCLWNYTIGLTLRNKKFSRILLGVGVSGNLILLLYHKYFNFIIDSLNIAFFPTDPVIVSHVHLPIGISFFTFQGLSYLIDVYRRETEPQKNPIRLSLYISLFPQLIAGPIVRYHDIAKQLKERTFKSKVFLSGIERFMIGLAKKVLIANVMGQLCDEIMKFEISGLSPMAAWLGIIAYALQIYFDFSGYSDMAIGLGRMFGFQFLENFNFPYISRSIREFWRRWHISLSSWFRDYLYIPLGGSRGGYTRTYLNLLIVFFVTGLWHGASWNFVIWGMFHGFFMIIERLGLSKILDRSKVLSRIYTLIVVLVAWVFFRIPDFATATDYIANMFGLFNEASSYTPLLVHEIMNLEYSLTLFAGILFSLPLRRYISSFNILKEGKGTTFLILRIIGVVIPGLYAILALSSNTFNPFIYFRF